VASLPNGTQYEGIERAVAGPITIRVMTGVELATVECALDPDGTRCKVGRSERWIVSGMLGGAVRGRAHHVKRRGRNPLVPAS
jgi:hypothetical protein